MIFVLLLCVLRVNKLLLEVSLLSSSLTVEADPLPYGVSSFEATF
jgi:hypothetical protein